MIINTQNVAINITMDTVKAIAFKLISLLIEAIDINASLYPVLPYLMALFVILKASALQCVHFPEVGYIAKITQKFHNTDDKSPSVPTMKYDHPEMIST